MRFLVDESAGPAVAGWLEEQGHDVVSVYDDLRGADDQTVLRRAHQEDHILIAVDEDFGEPLTRFRQPVLTSTDTVHETSVLGNHNGLPWCDSRVQRVGSDSDSQAGAGIDSHSKALAIRARSYPLEHCGYISHAYHRHPNELSGSATAHRARRRRPVATASTASRMGLLLDGPRRPLLWRNHHSRSGGTTIGERLH